MQNSSSKSKNKARKESFKESKNNSHLVQGPDIIQQPIVAKTTTQKNRNNSKNSIGNGAAIMTSEMDVRSWFENLPSGEDRAASMAVSDPAFIGMLMSMVVCNDNSSSSSSSTHGTATLNAIPKMTLSNKTAKAKDLAEAYDTHFHALEECLDSQLSTSGNLGPLKEPKTTVVAVAKTKATATKPSIDQGNINEVTNNPSSSASGTQKSESSNTNSTSKKIELNWESPSVEEIESTDAFRIQDETSSSMAKNSPSMMNVKKNETLDPDHAVSTISQSSSFGETKNEEETSSTVEPSSTTTTSSSSSASKTTTTLHFKSGLSLIISSDSESSKKVIASAGKISNTVPTTLPILPKLQSNSGTSKSSSKDNDVDSLLHFSALNLPTTSINAKKNRTSEDIKLTLKKNVIAQSKMSASRALSLKSSNSSSSATTKAGENLLKHICLVFTSALGMMKNTQKRKKLSGNKGDSKTNDDQIELLTVDPMYLKKCSGNEMNFLTDADFIIDHELKKLGKANNETHSRFLNDVTRIECEETTCKSKETFHPAWFEHFNESEDTCIPATIVLLARIEQAIRKSHQIYTSKTSANSASNSDADKNVIGKDNLNLVTPPPSPSRQLKSTRNTNETINSSEDGSTSDNFFTPCEQVSDEKSSNVTEGSNNESTTVNQSIHKVPPPPRFLSAKNPWEKTNKVDDSSFADFLAHWKHLQERNSHNDVVRNVKRMIRGKTLDEYNDYAEKVLQSFSLKDLLLVPICSVLLIQPSASKLGFNQTLAYVRLLVSEWSHIITTGLTKVQKDLAKKQLSDLDDSLVADLDLLLDDNAVAKPGAGKKKKRKKKKRKKGNSPNNAESQEEQKKSVIDSVPSKDTNRKSNDDMKDCTVSVVSSVSVATEASKQITSCPSNATLPISHVVKGAVVGSGRVEETDGHSSDGWETVEPKGGRTRKSAIASKASEKQGNDVSSTPLSPNSRRNKGKSKSRQRKQKAKEKEKEKEPTKRSVEPLEEGISKRGTNTIKALMEERNKRSLDDKKNFKEPPKTLSGRSSVADQNTAQTIPESLSGVSSAPVQTLVGPGNNNSASSSVASSLEAPHATRHKPHHHRDSCKEDDVGYHLLKVCERLSADMNTFMRRRSAALAVRRRERGALLAALQDTVQNVWAGQCHVETYGSCATGLELPSSDLDVVICGLNSSENLYIQQTGGVAGAFGRERSSSIDVRTNSFDGKDPTASPSSTTTSAAQRTYVNYPPQNFYPPLTANGNRVLRLAAELERQPWAVQVKAIPTASVPVIKILSDPSRLPGVASGIDWMLHQQHMAAAADMKMAGNMPSQNTPNSYPGTQLQWRGADVMNGLLSLDITFEGPEHGGILSTEFSKDAITEIVAETGLPSDSTPAVQVLMVIKELLAQRRLNEPFSGGLSSYAILLLVVAVLEERKLIGDEIEKVEKQKRAVAAGNNSAKTEKRLPKKSSWAAIAKKTCSANDGSDSSTQHSNPTPKSSQPPSNQPSGKQQQSQDEENKSGSENQSTEARDSTPFPQGSNDVLEVLCSGEATAGKLLMHFLLFYGRHFDARSTCIKIIGKRHPDYKKRKCSPFVNREPGGSYNPITDVYTVDPIVVYDPVEPDKDYNVTRSSYAFPTVAWTFLQCFNTLSGVVELGLEAENGRRNQMNASNHPQTRQSGSEVKTPVSCNDQTSTNAVSSTNELDDTRTFDNDLSPLLELLLSF